MSLETDPLRIVCVDVDYRPDMAVAAAIWFRGWEAEKAEAQAVVGFHGVAPYEPGAFYRRELPCLLGVLREGPFADLVIVDGYVSLDEGRAGLGAHLHHALDGRTPVVGVAKTRYRSANEAIEVLRGESASPLFVTAVGIDVSVAAEAVKRMHGPHRVPTLLRSVDQLARHETPGRILELAEPEGAP